MAYVDHAYDAPGREDEFEGYGDFAVAEAVADGLDDGRPAAGFVGTVAWTDSGCHLIPRGAFSPRRRGVQHRVHFSLPSLVDGDRA